MCVCVCVSLALSLSLSVALFLSLTHFLHIASNEDVWTDICWIWICVIWIGTGWRRLIGFPKLQIIFHKRATKYRSLLRKMTYKDKGSYESSPPCNMNMFNMNMFNMNVSTWIWCVYINMMYVYINKTYIYHEYITYIHMNMSTQIQFMSVRTCSKTYSYEHIFYSIKIFC